MIITIDGPAGSGKSSTAQALAKKLGYFYLNSGMHYRALAFLMGDDNKVPDKIPFQYLVINNEPKIILDGKDITDQLYNKKISARSAEIAQIKDAKYLLWDYQRTFKDKEPNIVAEGRDIGSELFKDADFKIFLTASDLVRAQRLLNDKNRKLVGVSLEEIIKMVQERDKKDRERELAPLVVPEGAIIIDNSNLSPELVLKQILGLIKSLNFKK